MAIDIATPEGVDLVRRLARISDIVVENYKPGDLARRGLAYEDLAAIKPDLIWCSISGFGQTGPYSHRRMGVADAARHTPGYQMIGCRIDQPGDLAVVEGEIDLLALPCAVAMAQRRQNAYGRVHAAHHVCYPDAGLDRRTTGRVRLACNAHDAAHGLDQENVPGNKKPPYCGAYFPGFASKALRFSSEANRKRASR
ncbi:CoA transferase (plasmid) [Ensifer canadensis]|nr:CoA transferase [Ensifer canadensis]